MMLAENLAISVATIAVCVFVQAAGVSILVRLSHADAGPRWHDGRAHRRGLLLMLAVFALLLVHAVQISIYAALYLVLGQFESWEASLYFATSTFTTLGYGDVFIGDERRMIAAVEGVIGLVLLGWSTAILVSATTGMGLLGVRRERSSG